ncbi:flagellar export protein FliJ [Pseudodesulfovibrio sp. F-1]|uniref:Flagellar FliJ protein n=1 Tax=Pseudodesulfovibrio alkaliphilus TaxID=2661613 RepID=A0A7K1KKH3_9BACT|nr:flagellar export protein FliJ [Pseudodesulfovibrio alkaliphilus]MUM76584.1 flagellar export protein FliJ [Pseudodesulfovibrio alkaliphilus]
MTSPFSFKLQKVLDYRTQLEDQARAALARAQAARDEQSAQVLDMESRLGAHLARSAEANRSANDLWLWRQYKDALEQDLVRERSVLSQLEHKLHIRRQEAVDRSRDKKLLEKLKETQARKHHAQEIAREAKENDEMATLRYEHEDF